MVGKDRRISERSLENLKLGAEARYQGKERHNFTVLPETLEWLKKGGNASRRIDELVAAAKSGELKSSYTHDRNHEQQLTSEYVYKQIETLQAELATAREQLRQLEQERDHLQSQLEQSTSQSTEQPNKEQECASFLASLRLGKQAPEYKRTKSILDRFITFTTKA